MFGIRSSKTDPLILYAGGDCAPDVSGLLEIAMPRANLGKQEYLLMNLLANSPGVPPRAKEAARE